VINQINRTFKSITPIFIGSVTLSKKSKPSFNNMSMTAFNHVFDIHYPNRFEQT